MNAIKPIKKFCYNIVEIKCKKRQISLDVRFKSTLTDVIAPRKFSKHKPAQTKFSKT